jgi:hypothetical protein
MLSREWLSAFVPIGLLHNQNSWKPNGAGVLLHDHPFIWLVTANHVVPAKTTDHIGVFVTNPGERQRVCIDLTNEHQALGLGWVRDAENDVATCLMPVNPAWDIKAVGEELCIKFEEVLPSMQCYTVGCPYGVSGVDPQRATPLVLEGIISGVDSNDPLIYISTPTFPGNSGGPILILRPPYNPAGSLFVGNPTVLLAGIVRDQLLVRGNEEGSPFLHLGRGVPISACIRLIKSEEARQQAARVPRPR